MKRPGIIPTLGVVFGLAFGSSLMAQSITILNGVTTAGQQAVLATFITSLEGGASASTSLSVSNILAAPPGSGFPSGSDESGPLSFYLFNNIGTVYEFHTAEHPAVGFGLDIEGSLAPGGTYTVSLHEILAALHPDRVPADNDFVGYAWIVAHFDAVAGTYFNTFPLVNATQAFQMQPTTGGIPVVLENR